MTLALSNANKRDLRVKTLLLVGFLKQMIYTENKV